MKGIPGTANGPLLVAAARSVTESQLVTSVQGRGPDGWTVRVSGHL